MVSAIALVLLVMSVFGVGGNFGAVFGVGVGVGGWVLLVLVLVPVLALVSVLVWT